MFRSLFVTCTFVFLCLLVTGCCAKKKEIFKCENPPSCGKIHNITYPFGIKGDPSNCGDPYCRLSCENNQTVLYLHSGRYLVQAINRDNHTIRITDPSLRKNDCSSVPLQSRTVHDLLLRYFLSGDPYSLASQIQEVVFLSCHNRVVDSSFYPIPAPCVSSRFSSSSYLSLSASKTYAYVVYGDVKVSDIPDACKVELEFPLAETTSRGNFSYLDLHDKLLYGFELSWFPIRCKECRYKTFSGECKFKTQTTEYEFLGCDGVFIQSIARLVLGAFILALLVMEIKKMSNGFKEKLGESGYASVYKGKLRSGRIVAIKMLNKPKSNGQEFINEVATIGRIHHANVVTLIGFCAERSKHALVYEYMANGSLKKYIFSEQQTMVLSCEQMYKIALGVARGIEYLHRGCYMRILHFDIKPHNILLDENFNPKVSDFGLAKLYPIGDSIVALTVPRGTMGYMAPELLFKNIGGVSYKADVYSFGMLLMEMASRRKNLNAFAEHTSQIYFPSWVYNQFYEGNEIEIRNATEEERKTTAKMLMVALWCIQMNPTDRSSMDKVLEMLEGELENIEFPPKPFLSRAELNHQES